jgi:hypothetical protein
MEDVFVRNARMRLAYLGITWNALAQQHGLKGARVRGWLAHGSPSAKSRVKLARILGVPAHALFSPSFNPRDYPIGGKNEEEDCDE